MISTIISAVLPILFVAFLGWLAGRMRLFGPDGTTALSTFVVHFALPWSLFLAAARTKPSQLTDSAYAASVAAGCSAPTCLEFSSAAWCSDTVFLIGVLPTAAKAAVLAPRYGAYAQEAAATTAANTFFSIISISLGLVIAGTL